MQCPNRREQNASDDEINAAIDGLLEEDRRQRQQQQQQCQTKRSGQEQDRDCSLQSNQEELNSGDPAASGDFDRSRHRGVEKSSRFAVRVTEALRALQRRCEAVRSFTTAEIVEYIGQNFRHDGDLEAQVRTTLDRTVSHGFVKKEGTDSYRLIGPFAGLSVNGTQRTLQRCNATPRVVNRRKRKSSCGSRYCVSVTRQNNDSEDDLSIPTSVELDILQNQIERDIDRLQGSRCCDQVRSCPSPLNPSQENQRSQIPRPGCSTPLNPNPDQRRLPTPRSGCSPSTNQSSHVVTPSRNCPSPLDPNPHQRRPPTPHPGCSSRSNQRSRVATPNRNCPSPASHDRDDRTRGQSSAGCGGSEDAAGAIRNPVEGFEVGVNLADFEGDDCDEEETNADSDDRLSEDDRFDDSDDVDSNDSTLNDIRARDGNAGDRDKELKRWVRNCRRECARKAAARNAQ